MGPTWCALARPLPSSPLPLPLTARGEQRTTGAFHAILQRHSFEDAVLVCQKSAVAAGTLTEAELKAVLAQFRPLVDDIEARNRIKRCSLVPVSVAVAACAAHGRCAPTVALLRALRQLPRVWELQLEQEQLRARLEVDLALEDEVAAAEEEEAVHLASELSTMVPFAVDKADEATMASTAWRLKKVPEPLERELRAFASYRQEALNIHRHGAAVVPVTCENDRATCLRFLGWLAAERGIAPGLGAFAQPETSQWVADWANALREQKGVKFSSLSNYTNSLITITHYVYNTYKVDEALHALPVTPLEELVRLRGQCESGAKQDRLFARADPNFLAWEDAQRARVKAEGEYRAASGPKRQQLLRDWLLLSLHTIQPPDRVGVIRKLRFNASLKGTDGGYVLDLTAQRSHKTSRFHGPSCTTLSPMLTEVLGLFLADLAYDAVEEDGMPYLFHPKGSTTRCVGSSQWTEMVK